jgi:hypothetical protein
VGGNPPAQNALIAALGLLPTPDDDGPPPGRAVVATVADLSAEGLDEAKGKVFVGV